MQKKRQRKMSERRRAVVATRKAEVAELKDERFADIARLVSEQLEPFIEKLVEKQVAKAIAGKEEEVAGVLAERQSIKAEVAKAVADLAERQSKEEVDNGGN